MTLKLLVLDANSVINRAFYGIKLLTTKQGEFTNAVVGFMNILLKLTAQEKPDAVAIAFDMPAKTFRHEMYDGYKAGRSPMPEELRAQFPLVKSLLTHLGYTLVECVGFEADDIVGTLADTCKKKGYECVIASGDRDAQQLIGDGVELLLTTTQFGRGETTALDTAAIVEKYGVTPSQLIDVKALAGDASDKIPGAKGIGEVTACKLLIEFATLEGIYENIDDTRIKPGVRTKLQNDKDMVFLSRKLATISTSAPINTDLASYTVQKGDSAAASELLLRLEMHKLRERLDLEGVVPSSVDSKTTPQIVLKQGSVDDKKPLCFVAFEGIAVTDGEVCETPNDERLAQLLSGEGQKTFYDAKFFYKRACELNIEVENASFDIKLAAYLLNPLAKDYELTQLAAEYGLGGDVVACAMPLANILSEKLEEGGMTALLTDIELPLSAVLADMEHNGFAVDGEGIRSFGEGLKADIDRLTTEIYEEVGYEFNLNSPKQLGVALFEKLGLPTRKKTKSGYSTDAETLESLAMYHPVVEKLLKYRTVQKLMSTYVEGLCNEIEQDGRIHTVFKQTETRTGRISSKEPNMQNIPIRTDLGRELRRFFVADEGKVLVDADYSQIELRIVAALSEDEHMKAAFVNGDDIHTITAANVYGVPTAMVTEQMRRSAKAVNFGIVYGIGAFSLAKDINVTVKEADMFIKNYLENFSGVDKFLKAVVQDASENGYVTTVFGRRRLIPELRAANFNVKKLGERIAMNTPIQGTAADVIKIAMVRVHKRLKGEKLAARLILQVHDELIVECSVDIAPYIKEVLKQEMEAAATLSVPLLAEVSSGKDWYSAH